MRRRKIKRMRRSTIEDGMCTWAYGKAIHIISINKIITSSARIGLYLMMQARIWIFNAKQFNQSTCSQCSMWHRRSLHLLSLSDFVISFRLFVS